MLKIVIAKSTRKITMSHPETSFDMEQALADLRELTRLSVAHGFDLCERMRCLENAGVVTLQIDGATAITAGSEVIRVITPGQSVFRYKLSDELLADLAALRAWNMHANKIEGSHSECP